MEEIKYICAVTGIEVQGTSESLPEGWLIPPLAVPQDIEKEPLPRGTVLALSSEDAWKELLRSRLAARAVAL